ncbi:hemophore [Mycolicibacterium litorale]|uniref:Hemophore n=1 Tax=Mycolicibacterium litorale TaxID=758802 RepID=A0AAD1IN01_9MYCO|nr:hemophore [Mycolicibacterium litorale]MCV7417196.1 hemophore [Mycolicibacterium litorale]TDY04984.1 hemophore [Mycolicibacterium litorale]BBY18414.1 hemophore [Mycolicibacterium litorale]
MKSIALRRSLYAAFAVTAAGGVSVAALTMPATPATAAPDPCAASQVAKTVAAVATNTSNYLAANPETDQALTTIAQQQGGPASLVALKSYLDANPEVGADMQKLQQPLTSLSGRCKLPVTIPQVLGLMQAAQQSGATLPAAGAVSPASSGPATAVTQGAGAQPGSGAATHR